MQPENTPPSAPPPAIGKPKPLLSEVERRRKELERQNSRRTHKPNLKTIPWKK